MEVEIIFEGIKESIISILLGAKEKVWVAVAWINDEDIIDILESKSRQGVDVIVILIDDEMNRKNLVKFNFLKQGEKLFLLNSHHKYCIVDDEYLITGSYNWTKGAMYRGIGENILISVDANIIENTNNNFYSLLGNKAFEKFRYVDYCIEMAKDLSYGDIVDRSDIEWWFSLNQNWKLELISEIQSDFDPVEMLTEEDLSKSSSYASLYVKDIEEIEARALNEFIILILNIVNYSSLDIREELNNDINPLIKLKQLRSIECLSVNSVKELKILCKHINDIDIGFLTVDERFSSEDLVDNIFQHSKEIEINVYPIDKKIINCLPKSTISLDLRLDSNFKQEIKLSWFSLFHSLTTLHLKSFKIRFSTNDLERVLLKNCNQVRLSYCQIQAPKQNIFNLYNSLVVEQSCYFIPSIAKYQAEFNDKSLRYLR